MRTTNRIWVIATVVGSLAALALGWFLGVSPRVTEITTADAERQNVEGLNAQSEAEIAALQEEYKKLDDYQSQLDVLRVSIPDDSDLTGFIRQISNLAVVSGVTVSTFTPAAELPFTPVGSDGAATAEASTNFFLVPVSLSVKGSYGSIMSFLSMVQNGDRLFLLSTFTYKNDSIEGADLYSAQIDGFIFVLLGPASAGITPSAPAAPDPSTVATPTPTPTETAPTFPLSTAPPVTP